MPARDPEGMRHIIAAQTTVPRSVSGLLRAVCSQTYAAIEANDFGPVKALADAISANPKAWSDAVMANTPSAMETAGFAQMPTYVGSATVPTPATDQPDEVSSRASLVQSALRATPPTDADADAVPERHQSKDHRKKAD